MLAGFGLLTGAGMLVGGRWRAGAPTTCARAGVALLGGGLLAGTAASSLPQGAVPFAAAAVGAGLVTALGFPYFARFIPTAAGGPLQRPVLPVRAIAAAAALPAAGVAIAVTGSYRSLLVMGGARAPGAGPARARRARRRPATPRAAPRARPSRAASGSDPRVPARSDALAVVAAARCATSTRSCSSTTARRHVARAIDDAAARPARAHRPAGGNHGKGTAVAAGIGARARARPPDAVVVLDSDGQHPPERIPAFVARRGAAPTS